MIRFKNLSLKGKLISIQLFMTFIVLLLYCVYTVVERTQQYKSTVTSEISTMAQLIGDNCISALKFLDNSAAERVLSTLSAKEDIVSAQIYDADGNLFVKYSRTGYDGPFIPRIDEETIEFNGGYFTLTKKIIQDGNVIGMIALQKDMQELSRIIKTNIIGAFLILALGMIIALLLSILTQRAISKPILKLVEVVEGVKKNSAYEIKIEEKSNDEIGILASAFEEMMQKLAEREHDLSKRNKEVNCLYSISNLTHQPDLSIEKTFQAAANLVPPGWQYPDITCVRLKLENRYFKTDNFKKTKWKLSADIKVHREKVGSVEVSYLEEMPELYEGPYLEEERNLINAIATRLGETIEAKQAEEKLKEYSEHLEELVKARTKELEEINMKLLESIEEVKDRTSELEKQSADLEQANLHLLEADRHKSIFLANMSHELRTPLNSIIGFTGIVLQGLSGEINEEQRKQLTMSKNSANHLLSLINDVLDVSKIETGEVEIVLEEFSFNDVVRGVIENFLPLASKKDLELCTDVPEGITLLSDKRRFNQVLVNLVSNAVKFTAQGSVKIIAEVSNDKNLEIRVIDTGMGIKKEDMNKLFTPFQQIDMSSTKSYEGTGLGLHLSRKLATLLKGDISVKSEYGSGSVFILTIPLKMKEDG